MGDGTESQGRMLKRNLAMCQRCGSPSFHKQKNRCAKCGFPKSRIRKYNWALKAQRRRTTGTGRMRHLRVVQRKFKHGFRHGTEAKPRSKKGQAKAAKRAQA